MATYIMSVDCESRSKQCKSQTLLGAKREATNEYKDQYRGSVIRVHEVCDGQHYEMVTKALYPGSRWEGDKNWISESQKMLDDAMDDEDAWDMSE